MVAANIIRMSLRQIMALVAKRASTAVATADSATLARISARTGMNITAGTARSALRTIQNNKIATAFVLYELGAEFGDDLLALRQADPDVDDAIAAIERQAPDSYEDVGGTDLSMFSDEFAAISAAISFFGSIERFEAVRHALSCDQSTVLAYIQTRSIGRRLR